MNTTATEIKASDIRKGDIINLVHEVISVRKNKNFGYLEIKTGLLDGRAQFRGNSKLVLYPNETVMRSDVAA